MFSPPIWQLRQQLAFLQSLLAWQRTGESRSSCEPWQLRCCRQTETTQHGVHNSTQVTHMRLLVAIRRINLSTFPHESLVGTFSRPRNAIFLQPRVSDLLSV